MNASPALPDSRHLDLTGIALGQVQAQDAALEQHQPRDKGRIGFLIVQRRSCATSVDTGTPNTKANTDGDANIRPERDEDFDPRLRVRRRGRADGSG